MLPLACIWINAAFLQSLDRTSAAREASSMRRTLASIVVTISAMPAEYIVLRSVVLQHAVPTVSRGDNIDSGPDENGRLRYAGYLDIVSNVTLPTCCR